MNTESKPHNIAEGNKGEEKPKSAFEGELLKIKTVDELLFFIGLALSGKELEAATSAVGVLAARSNEVARRNFLGSEIYIGLKNIFPDGLHEKIVSLIGEPIYRASRTSKEKFPTN